jgi:hypothetical protein
MTVNEIITWLTARQSCYYLVCTCHNLRRCTTAELFAGPTHKNTRSVCQTIEARHVTTDIDMIG